MSTPEIRSWEIVRAAGAHMLVGKAFAFVRPEALAVPSLSWVKGLLGRDQAPQPRVLSLLGPNPVELPGASLPPVELPELRLAVVTSDKALYREGRDAVNLLVVDPASPAGGAVLELSLNGAEHTRRPLRLDAAGAAAVRLVDLPCGDYEARLAGADPEDPACAFTVAEYRLSPLVASLAERRLEGQRLHVVLRLESFGVGVEGGVRVELLDRGQRLAEVKVEAREGLARASFVLEGEGPHALAVQLASDPSRTASVPITGSRAAERSQTVFSPLGTEVRASLLPGPDTREVRSLHLGEGAVVTTPFRVEGVGTSKPRLVAGAGAEAVKVVLVDPTRPRPRPGAVDPASAPHPEREDEAYRSGVALFRQERFLEAAGAFAEARSALGGSPHPNYAYFEACCHGRRGDAEGALVALRQAVRDGWRDLAHMAADTDLAPLRGRAGFEAVLAGTRPRELDLGTLAPGAEVELPLLGPLTWAVVGGFVQGSPWEGWAALVAPDALAARLTLPEKARPGEDLTVTVEASGAGSAYVVVKDARLLAGDKPGSRLAGQIKGHVEAGSGRLAVGRPTETLADLAESLRPINPPFVAMATGAMPGVRFSAAPPPAPTAFASQDDDFLVAYASAPDIEMETTGAEPECEAPPELVAKGPAGQAPRATGVDEPDVLFAGLVPLVSGRASVTVRLPGALAEYVAEALVVGSGDWAATEGRVRAEKTTYASLDLPPFVHPQDAALATLHAGCSGGRLRVSLTRDGSPAPLLLGGRALAVGEVVEARRAALSFLAGPGEWSATVADVATGEVDRCLGRVEPPGSFVRLARTLRLLETGENAAVALDPSIVALKVMPGVDTTFHLLLDATTDYGHACCEQTAAKVLAACSLYALGEEGKRAKAEEIVLAGIRRERSMHLPGRGFKMYPESPDVVDTYWGPKAARYLWSLGGLEGLSPSPALREAVKQGLAMAGDACRAYRIDWPPQKPATCEECWAAARFGTSDAARAKALALVRDQALQVTRALAERSQGVVLARCEAAFAAATLLRLGEAGDRRTALALANAVLRDLDASGRLYSTVDSAAAVALLGEVQAAGLGRNGVVGVRLRSGEVRRLTTGEAAELPPDEVTTVTVAEGAAAVEVTRRVEEDWTALAGTLDAAIALEREGRATRRLALGQAAELRVTLREGYRPGDVLWVCLPHSLTRVVGGGQVKLFSLDFAGRDELVVPLAVTSPTVDAQGDPAPQRFAVCVRNMFEEERAACPGFLEVRASRG